MAALAAWPGVPGLYHCHGSRPFDEQPPRHPRLVRYLSMAERNVEWIRESTGVRADHVATLPNWVDLCRFSTVRTPPARPARAAWFVNRLSPGTETEAVGAACRRSNIPLDLVGAGFGTATDEPERVLPKYDIVFATGRSALEALACGCAVVSCEPERIGPMVSAENLDAMTALNFCVDGGHPDLSVEAVAAVLGTWNPDDAAAVTARVRGERSLETAVRALTGHYEAVQTQFRDNGPGDVAESQAWVDYLRFLRERTHQCDEAFAAARREARQAVARTERAEARLDEAKRSQRAIIDRLRATWWGRRWLRRASARDPHPT
jgi:hypothetical protein